MPEGCLSGRECRRSHTLSGKTKAAVAERLSRSRAMATWLAMRTRTASSRPTGRRSGAAARQELPLAGANGPWLHSRPDGHLRAVGDRRGEILRRGPCKEFVRAIENGKEFAAHEEVAEARVVLLRAAVPGTQPERAHWSASISRRRPTLGSRSSASRTCPLIGWARRWVTELLRGFSTRGERNSGFEPSSAT